jgi:hypothetical protein
LIKNNINVYFEKILHDRLPLYSGNIPFPSSIDIKILNHLSPLLPMKNITTFFHWSPQIYSRGAA